MFDVGDWLWSNEHRQPCKVVKVTRLWDDVGYHVWLSSAKEDKGKKTKGQVFYRVLDSD